MGSEVEEIVDGKLSEKHPIIAKKINESLKKSLYEGGCSATTVGLGSSYFVPFALTLNATTSQIGILNGLVNLLPAVVQLKASRLIEKFSRKKVATISVILQALILIPILLSPLLFILNVPYAIWILIGLIVLFYVFGSIAHPAWFSWMGSLVPAEERGRYFSRRNKIAGFFGLIAMILGALILDYSKKLGFVFMGFGILFIFAMIFRLISAMILMKQYEPKLKIHKKAYFSLWQFLKKASDTPFGRFTIFTSVMKIAINIAAPFFAVYMLKDLGFSYTWFMAITVSGVLFQLFFYPILGKFSDTFGNIELLRVSSIMIILSPLLWIISSNPFYLLTIPSIVGGFGWAGFWLSTSNYIYDSVRQEKRGYGLAYFNFLNSVGLFVGAGIGTLISLSNITFMNKILFIFLISGIARLITYLVFSPYLQEVKHVKKFSSQFIVRGFQPVRGIIHEIHHLNHRKKDIKHYI